jgi:protein-S-isoprenylcysteine O-methyltransferase Ste14
MMRRRPRSALHWARALVPALFALAAAGKAMHGVRVLEHALSQPTTRSWLLALYALLQTGVALSFAVFTVGRADPRRLSRSPVAILACAVALTGVLAFEGPAKSTPEGLLLLGELVAIASCAWLLASVAFLGRNFGVLPAARGLVTRGPYRLVRHPVYLGEIGACAGLALAAPSPVNAAVLGALLLAQTVRMRLEERALCDAFPEYEAYALRTPRLLPRVRSIRPAASDSSRLPGDALSAGQAPSAFVSRATSRA